MNNQQKASDPNTPLIELFYLGNKYPKELMNNPIFPLIPLENPNFLDEMPIKTQIKLIKQKECPQWFLDLFYNSFKKITFDIKIDLIKQQECPKKFIELFYLENYDSPVYKEYSLFTIIDNHPNIWNELRIQYPDHKLKIQGRQFNGFKHFNQNLDLSNIDLTQSEISNFNNVNLNNSNCSYCKFYKIGCTSIHLSNVNFKGSHFMWVAFSKSTLEKCDFSRTHFAIVHFDNTTFIDCNFADARLGNKSFNPKNL